MNDCINCGQPDVPHCQCDERHLENENTKLRAALVKARKFIVNSEDHQRAEEFDVELLAEIDGALGKEEKTE